MLGLGLVLELVLGLGLVLGLDHVVMQSIPHRIGIKARTILLSLVNTSDVDHFDDKLLVIHCSCRIYVVFIIINNNVSYSPTIKIIRYNI